MLIILMIAVIPFLGIPDIIAAFRSGRGALYLFESRLGGERASGSFLYLREILLFVFTVVLFLWLALRGRPLPRLQVVPALLVSVVSSLAIALILYPPLVALSGLRQFTYLTLVYSLYFIRIDSPRIEPLFVRVLIFVAVCEFIPALAETALLGQAEDNALLGPRAYGTFNDPNTLAVTFALIVFCVLFFGTLSRGGTLLVIGVAIASELMSGSRTGMVAVAFVLLAYAIQKMKTVETRGMVITLAILLIIPLYYSLTMLSGREGAVDPHRDPRVEIFLDELEGKGLGQQLFGRGLGVGTSTLYALSQGKPEYSNLVRILDSTYTGLLVQIGLVGLGAFLLSFACLAHRCGVEGWILFGVMLIVGVNGNVLEYYPFNLILAASFGILWARRVILRKHTFQSVS